MNRAPFEALLEPMRAKDTMTMTVSRWLLLVGLLGASFASAQDACESKCNQASAECLRVCVAKPSSDPKEQQSAKMMSCLNSCEVPSKVCRERCHSPKTQ